MPRGRGERCPFCHKYRYHDKGSYKECSNCGYIGWPWGQPVEGVGSGRGNKCPWCKELTLHDVKFLRNDWTLRRCSTCNYTAIEPPRL